MTKSTLIHFCSMFLIPKHLLLNNSKKLKQIYKSFSDHTEKRDEMAKQVENIEDYKMGRWPMPYIFKYNDKTYKFDNLMGEPWLGGNGTLKFNVQKIHNIYAFPTIDEQLPYFDLSMDFLILGSSIDFNKYLHEDY